MNENRYPPPEDDDRVSQMGASVVILATCLVAFVIFVLLAIFFVWPAKADEFVVPDGTRTDCGPNFSSYQIRAEVQCKVNDIACGKIRWGPMFPLSSNAGQCQASEAELAASSCFETTYGRSATWQDRLDMALSVAPHLAREVMRVCCFNGGNCTLEGAQVLRRDDGLVFKRRGAFGRVCDATRADQEPCGAIEGWNCYWNWPLWFDNKAPHCLGAVPAPFCGDGICLAAESCSSCEADCGRCVPVPPPIVSPPLHCFLVGEPRWVPGLNSTGRLENLFLECKP